MRRTLASPILAISSNKPSAILAEALSASIRTASRGERESVGKGELHFWFWASHQTMSRAATTFETLAANDMTVEDRPEVAGRFRSRRRRPARCAEHGAFGHRRSTGCDRVDKPSAQAD